MIQIVLSFLEGIVLITSPCILPVLLMVLAASLEGGEKKVFGVIAGFVLSFTAFTLIAHTPGINPVLVRNSALALLFLFGLGLLSETAFRSFGTGEGFVSCMGLGALIGFVWCPYPGPIFATLLVQLLHHEANFLSYVLVFAFSLGAGISMLVLTLCGKQLMKHRGITANTLRKPFGALVVISVLFIASGFDPDSLASPQETPATSPLSLEKALATPYPAPEIVGISDWFNSKPLTIASLKGKVVLVDFWTYSCVNCVRTLPHITDWDKKYRDKGLVIIGVHTPEFEFEKNADNVKAALAAHGITYPVALDDHMTTWKSFDNHYWPAHYLIDKQGKVVYTHFGEHDYDITENNIRYLLGLKDKVAADDAPAPAGHQTPETYVGYNRMQHFAGGNTTHDVDVRYHLPDSIPADNWALEGKWNVGAENITAKEKGAKITLHFVAKKVFLVLGNKDKPIHLSLTLNGKPLKSVTVDHHSLYELASQDKLQDGTLEITSDSAGLEAYAFTFGQ